MPKIISIGTAAPKYIYTQNDVLEQAKLIFDKFPNLHRYLSVFNNTGIKKRHFCVPLEWYRSNHSFSEKNNLYITNAIDLGYQAILQCLQNTPFSFGEIDQFIFVSTTGFSTPSIDAQIINKMNVISHMKRTPIWGLGCAGGAAGLARAFEYTKAFPTHKVIVVALELCGLTFNHNDFSKSNIIATSLFGDGAASVLVCGDEVKLSDEAYPQILGSYSTLYPNSLDVMGWDINDEGLKVIFSRDIPSIVNTLVKENMKEFTFQFHLDLDQIHHYILHPGGTKVLEAYQEALSISSLKTKIAKEILQDYGNMSSATVLFVLEQYLKIAKSGEYGLLAALGPGFSSELILLRWE